MKKIISTVLCLLLLLTIAVPVSAEGSMYISLSASSSVAYPGDTIDFYISVSGGGTCDSFGYLLSYDSSVFEYVGGSAYVPGAALCDMSGYGLVASYSSPQAPSGTVANFTLRVRSDASFGDYYVSGSPTASGASASGGGAGISVICSHSYGDWQKYDGTYHQKTCAICSDSKEEEHSWNEGAVVSAPTCKDEGSKTYTCTACGETKTETMEKTLDHKYGNYQKLDGNQHSSTCSVCGNVLNASHNWDAGTVTKKETCKETGITKYTCTDCAATREETIPLSTNHSFSAWQKVDDGKHTHSCSVCGKVETVDHNWNEGSVTKKPTCKEKGTCVYSCLGCGHTKTEELPVSTTHTYDHGCDKVCNVCSAERTTSHNYDGWSRDFSEHWHECTECGEEKDRADHVPGPEATEENAQYCTVCDYMIKAALAHEHNYEETYKTDKTGHWYACTGCDERKDFAKHAFDNDCDGVCEVCKYTREVKHNIGEKWFADAKGHFQKCEVCGKEETHIRHSAGPEATEQTPQICEVCNYELAPALGHSFGTDWTSDELTHFHACACGEKKDTADHSWDEGIKADNGKLYTCMVCQHQKFEPRDQTWVIISAAAAALAATAGAVVLVIKRKRM